jgi:hypothetical protein
MSAGEKIASAFHWAGNRIHSPNPNKGDRAVQPLPAVDFSPVNEPGSKQPFVRPAWNTMLGSASQQVGMVWHCQCGQSNPFLASPRYNLYRELEKDHFCQACCVEIINKYTTDEQGKPQFAGCEQVRRTAKNENGNEVPVGARFNLLDLLPDQGKHMSEKERDRVYATLPTWRLVQTAGQQLPMIDNWGKESNSPVWEGIKWEGSSSSGDAAKKRDEGFERGDPGYTGLF